MKIIKWIIQYINVCILLSNRLGYTLYKTHTSTNHKYPLRESLCLQIHLRYIIIFLKEDSITSRSFASAE
ncbi:hypothetical protein FGO68_gene8689 [Halteria grandinella]|uniref:Uncharacterized protein n=1 Tax=Halteria grandinella TaxID=5974 RepID=A0A8J8T965_HALGN|nr:hypothetical protein FGO68_gene8689 [Halteria grandinella]